jgi:PAS domain S-box-containing protein
MGANRVMAICAIWSVAGLVSMHRKREIRHARHRGEAEKTMALLAAVVESSGDAVITNALDGRVTSWNAGAERLFGYTASEAIGQPASLIVPFDCADEERLIVAEITEGRRIESFETVHARKDGGRVHVSLTVSPIRDDHGVIIGTSKVARDITARKTAEAELLRHTLALERSNKDLDDFAYIASHDLREPLRGLANNAKFLAEDYETKLDQGGLQRLHRMGYLTRRLDQLINDLLYFSRLGRQDMAIQRTDLNAVIADIAATMSLDEHGATIEIARPLPVIVCDKPRVTEALRNLITNALKYNTSATKRIEIGCIAEMATPQGLETQVFYVKDNGVGIEKEFHDEVFRIFKRLNEEDDTKKGTGVGLTFVRKIVERHGGRIWINSKPGAGTTFYFTLHERAAHVAAA